MINSMIVEVKDKGIFEVIEGLDSEYPGVDVEFIPNGDVKGTHPRIVFEYPIDGQLRLLIWDDPQSEDYSRKIEFDV